MGIYPVGHKTPIDAQNSYRCKLAMNFGWSCMWELEFALAAFSGCAQSR